MDESDVTLIKASWRDPEAFSELFNRHFVSVHAYCVRRGGRDRADDLAGETFRIAFERRRRYDLSMPDARPWLLGIALNTVRNDLRSRGRESAAYLRLGLLPAVVTDAGAAAVAHVDAQRDLTVVAAALHAAPVEEVDTLLLHVWEGLSYKEVGVALGVPVGTVGSRINRLRAHLRDLLDEAPDSTDELPQQTPPDLHEVKHGRT